MRDKKDIRNINKIRKNKKGVEIAMNTTVMAALAIIAFLFIVFLMTDKFGLFNKTTKDCKVNQGEVLKADECSKKGGTQVGTPDKKTKEVCCVTQCSSMGGECKASCSADEKYKCISVSGCSTCKVLK